MNTESVWLWIGFFSFIVLMLWLDLAVFNRKSHRISVREALGWSALWISLAFIFNALVYYHIGPEKSVEFITGYLIEESLSVDNLFVILLIFGYFNVQQEYQHKVLYWGIFGALVLRFLMIILGISLIERFHFVTYIFGAFLVITGLRMVFGKERELHPDHNPVVRLFKRFMPVTSEYHGEKFFVRVNAKLHATPLFLVVLVVEATDLVFALDSIPAVLSISSDPFIVYTSNAFAVLGLRSLFFALAGVMNIFHYLKYGLSAVLIFIGVKMAIEQLYDIPTFVSLLVVGVVLSASVILSLLIPVNQVPDSSISSALPNQQEKSED